MRIKPHLNGALLYVCQISLTSRFQPKPSHFVSLHDTFRFCDYIYNKGYKANIQTSVLFANNSGLSSISSSHGYSFGNGLYLGGGTGIVYSPLRKLNVRNQIIIPFFGEIKYSFLKNTIVSPFVDVVAGGAYNYSSYGTGYLLKPSVGLDVWRFSASVGFGRYAINYATVDGRQNGEPAIIGDKETSTGLFISIAYNFR